MTAPLRILHLEDDPDDAALVRRKLETAGLDCRITQVETRAAFAAELARPGLDLILSDFTVPGFGGPEALAMARAAAPDVPFIFVSGTMGEDTAVGCLIDGATDYLLKTSTMTRLAPAIGRALEEKRNRAERRRLEEQYRQAQKMEAVGRLAGGVAHDFNNLLTAILGYAELAQKDVPPGKVQEDLKEIVATTLRAAQLARQLLTFSRKSVAEPKVVDVNDLVRGVESMLRRVIGEDVDFVFQAGSGVPPVLIDPGRFEQLVVNLSVNARDAMPQGGRLTLSTSAASPDAELRSRFPEACPGDHALLSVRDTGVGLAPEARAHLFEPFFTTKEKGQGTGLGLATCYGIVKQAGGLIDVLSEPGRGAEFRVYLPRTPLKAAPARPAAPVAKCPKGSELLLVVEDEEGVRRLMKRLLRDIGYEVLEAADGRDALRLLEQDRERRVRLAIADVVLPGLSGKGFAERVSAARPDVKVLFTSGYADEALGKHGVLDDGIRFLPKPFTRESLARKVREALDGA